MLHKIHTWHCHQRLFLYAYMCAFVGIICVYVVCMCVCVLEEQVVCLCASVVRINSISRKYRLSFKWTLGSEGFSPHWTALGGNVLIWAQICKMMHERYSWHPKLPNPFDCRVCWSVPAVPPLSIWKGYWVNRSYTIQHKFFLTESKRTFW